MIDMVLYKKYLLDLHILNSKKNMRITLLKLNPSFYCRRKIWNIFRLLRNSKAIDPLNMTYTFCVLHLFFGLLF